jgi:hypothetical protein
LEEAGVILLICQEESGGTNSFKLQYLVDAGGPNSLNYLKETGVTLFYCLEWSGETNSLNYLRKQE